jgi:hypothetical protein
MKIIIITLSIFFVSCKDVHKIEKKTNKEIITKYDNFETEDIIYSIIYSRDVAKDYLKIANEMKCKNAIYYLEIAIEYCNKVMSSNDSEYLNLIKKKLIA